MLAPGSRLTLNYQFAGEPAAVARYQHWLTPRLGPSDRLIDVHEGRPAIGSALDRAERYLEMASLVAVLLAGVAIAMAARRYSERHFDVSAMLRCLGAGQNDIVGLYAPQLLLLGLIGSGLGVLLGWGAQFGLFLLLRELLPTQLPPPGPLPALLGLLTGLVVLAGFGLPPVLRLKNVPALRVLRRELTPMPLRAWLVYAAALSAMSLLLWRYTGNALLTLVVLGGALATLVIFGGLAWLLLRASRALHHGVGVAWRYGLNNLWRRPWLGVGQILAFGVVLMAMAIIALLRDDLLATWQTQLPARAPNHFVINILPDQVAPFSAFLRERHIASAQIYPMVRGRLTAVNGVAVAERARREGDEPIHREFNLTWSDNLQQDNVIIAGHWWQASDRGKPRVSVEQGVAERLGIKLGDTLSFSFGGQALLAKVASLRTVQWDSFKPNFFMIFPPGVIDQFPATYITSFYLPPTRRTLLAQLVRSFPAVTVIDLDRIMDQVRRILAQVTLAVEYVLVLVLLAGFAVLYAALQASLDERLYEGALLRTLGASRYQLRAGHLAEYALLGTLAGLLAAAGAELIAWLLYTRVFHLDYQLKWQLWALLPPLGALLIGAAGYWGTRRVVQRSPLVVPRALARRHLDRLVGRQPAIPYPRLRAHQLRPAINRHEWRHNFPLCHRRNLCCLAAGSRRGQRPGCPARRRRVHNPAVSPSRTHRRDARRHQPDPARLRRTPFRRHRYAGAGLPVHRTRYHCQCDALHSHKARIAALRRITRIRVEADSKFRWASACRAGTRRKCVAAAQRSSGASVGHTLSSICAWAAAAGCSSSRCIKWKSRAT